MTAETKTLSTAVPIAALIIAMVSFQLGAVLAKGLFPIVGVAGAAALRLALASIILFAAWRPWRMRFSLREARAIIVYGLAMGWMNFFFYLSLRSIPLGIAVALEFSGPLAVALLASRRPSDFLWVSLAALGLLALLPLGFGTKPLAPAGVGYALAAGVCWALYIVFGRQSGRRARRPDDGIGNAHRRNLYRTHRFCAQRGAAFLFGDPAGRNRRRAAVERAALFAGNVCAAARSDPHLWRADEFGPGAWRTRGPVFFRRELVVGFSGLPSPASWLASAGSAAMSNLLPD